MVCVCIEWRHLNGRTPSSTFRYWTRGETNAYLQSQFNASVSFITSFYFYIHAGIVCIVRRQRVCVWVTIYIYINLYSYICVCISVCVILYASIAKNALTISFTNQLWFTLCIFIFDIIFAFQSVVLFFPLLFFSLTIAIVNNIIIIIITTILASKQKKKNPRHTKKKI